LDRGLKGFWKAFIGDGPSYGRWKILGYKQQCRCSNAVAEHPFIRVKNDRALVAATPRGQHDELFPDLPAPLAAVLTGCVGLPWEKIHGAREHNELPVCMPIRRLAAVQQTYFEYSQHGGHFAQKKPDTMVGLHVFGLRCAKYMLRHAQTRPL